MNVMGFLVNFSCTDNKVGGGTRRQVYQRGPHVGYRVFYLFEGVARVSNGANCDSSNESWYTGGFIIIFSIGRCSIYTITAFV